MLQKGKKSRAGLICARLCAAPPLSYMYPLVLLVILLPFFSCGGNKPISALKKQDLFDLQYGNFENELKLFNLRESAPVNTRLIMHDGFFYLANGEAGKIMQLTSYGDLTGILYNQDKNPVPSFVDLSGNKSQSALEYQGGISTQKAVVYPFNEIGPLAVDSQKRLYAADILPRDRYVYDEKTKTLLRAAVLRFNADGSFIDYLGQEGPGGTPFPYIKNIYTTKQNEPVVVCLSENGFIVFWFSRDGYLRYKVPISMQSLPGYEASLADNVFVSFDHVVPDYNAPVLYLKLDYFPAEIDNSTRVQSGMNFDQTLVFPYNLETERYEEPVAVPDFEQAVSRGYTKEVFPMGYDFLGLTESGWFFFITADESGFSILILRQNGQKIIRRHLEVDLENTVYHHFSLSPSGIISALLAKEDSASVVWWRTDTLIDTIIR
ncbi:hypothetical protein V1L52_07380 [Treponema sp. HNW]|uniref:LIC_12708 family protein n=1 Tax=Treponema sp. HNW TaxID=3116654 RepID=UPI003D151E6C